MVWAYVSAVCMACAYWLGAARISGTNRLKAAESGVNESVNIGLKADAAWIMLVLRMMQVALQQGTSIPRALVVVGGAVGGEYGTYLKHVGESLGRGVSWPDAWRSALPGEDAPERSETGLQKSRDDADGYALEMIRVTLESAWLHGDSPGARIDAAIEQLDADERSHVEREAARLSVRLLMPTGLCFLPAFVIIGVIPAIASFWL